MLLAVDIGNTNITIGMFRGAKIIKRVRLETSTGKSFLKRKLVSAISRRCLDRRGIEAAVISSVVPAASKIMLSLLRSDLKIKAFLLGKDIIIPIKNLYKDPKQVGQDRLVNAYACLKLYRAPAVIIDFGTATTFDIIDKNGAYCGGLITPGAEITINALAEKTALLPKIELKKPKDLIGKETVDSIRSGIFYGISSMCDGIIDKIEKVVGKRIFVLATGGLASTIKPFSKCIDLVNIDLTLQGIRYAYIYTQSHAK